MVRETRIELGALASDRMICGREGSLNHHAC
jgi:hypothetical protein